jgi:hypothetical protein
MFGETRLDADRAHLIGGTAGWAHGMSFLILLPRSSGNRLMGVA